MTCREQNLRKTLYPVVLTISTNLALNVEWDIEAFEALLLLELHE